ncbi:unnamed protein product [Amaranthus hypochondriacus]
MAIFNLKALVFMWICLVVPSVLAKPVKYCDNKGNYPVKVKGVDIVPDPVKPGKEAVFSISASSVEAISGGKVKINVAYFGLPVHSQTIDLCKETSCPVAAGDFVLSHSQTLPIFTPPGSYTLKMTMESNNNHMLTCIKFDFSIGFGASVSDS